MKNIFALLFILVVFCKCQSNPDQKNQATVKQPQLSVIIPTIQEKVYDRPTVKGLGIALVQPQETLQVLDTMDYFFYKVKLQRSAEVKEGYVLKAAFTDKPHFIAAESLAKSRR
ncbi:hypothetical protein [Adhaeribacter pallidiroseus]|uniref:Uncharacterized protein n=1 Tax=Adhaeribacter pallidiroseus TaxID=2072847 RepID=A0A369QRI2_9BACT|nr:hypothetical protein [Adhaeribacter pallidiroseus]RDC65429.1 hypothetical protein AHMF7616_04059 [Adhaeribacter pallidiroseus]